MEQARRAVVAERVAPVSSDVPGEAGERLWDDATVTGITITVIDDEVGDKEPEPPPAGPHRSSPSGTMQERA